MGTSAQHKQKHPLWQQLSLGGSSCAIATLFTHPIDTVKLRIQLQGAYSTSASTTHYRGVASGFYHVVRAEGVSALYHGLSPAILRAATYSASRLGLYEPLRSALSGGRDPSDVSVLVKVSAAVLSGAIGAVVGNPCELVKVRMQKNEAYGYNHVFHGFQRIVNEEGVAALWRGTYPAAVRAALLTSSQLATYDQSKVLLKRYAGIEEGASAHVGAAMTAGLITTTVSTPADVVKSIIMHSKQRIHPVQCVSHIIKTEGMAGLLRGWSANYYRLGPHTLITVVTYENLRTAFGWNNL